MRSRGFTLIEILVGLMILSLLLGMGFVSFREFSRRQQVTNLVRQIRVAIRLTQNEILAGRKPSGCGTLTSYHFVRAAANRYEVRAICTGPNLTSTIRRETLPTGATLTFSSSPALSPANTIVFKALGEGTNIPNSGLVIQLQVNGISYTETIDIGPTGNIQ